MSTISIDFSKARPLVGQQNSIAQNLDLLSSQLDGIRNGLRFKIAAEEQISARLQLCATQVSAEGTGLRNMSDGFGEVISYYDRVEAANQERELAEHPGGFRDNGGTGGTSASGRREELEERANGWGKGTGTVTPVEYALLCSYCNTAASEGSEAEMAEAFWEKLQELPENHPLKRLTAERKRNDVISAVRNGNGMEAIVIRLDSDNAIVLFAGTDSVADGLTDAGILADGSLGVAGKMMNMSSKLSIGGLLYEDQFESANKLIRELSKTYSNISVSGHSLGGHLAADVTLNNSSISECVTFDPPGRGDTWMRTTFDPGDRVSKITNYVADGSVVSAVGDQIGRVEHLSVESNWAGPFPNHGIDQMKDALGGDSAIEQFWAF